MERYGKSPWIQSNSGGFGYFMIVLVWYFETYGALSFATCIASAPCNWRLTFQVWFLGLLAVATESLHFLRIILQLFQQMAVEYYHGGREVHLIEKNSWAASLGNKACPQRNYVNTACRREIMNLESHWIVCNLYFADWQLFAILVMLLVVARVPLHSPLKYPSLEMSGHTVNKPCRSPRMSLGTVARERMRQKKLIKQGW